MLLTALSFIFHSRCKSGVKISGTASSDVICNEPNSDTYSTTLPTSNTITTLRGLITQRPHEGAKTQGMDTTTTPRVATSTKKVLPTPPVYPGNQIGKPSSDHATSDQK